ncbi:MAG: hypothetical protein N3G20_06875, partial [Verrucomicrobiae bacterium]|nr:hypothetical protein [Verrucomicrobiae bacterium]
RQPFHDAHSTAVAGLTNIHGGDSRFYNNIFIGQGRPTANPRQDTLNDPQWTGGYGLWVYDFREFPIFAGGNVYCNGARPWKHEIPPVILHDFDPKPTLSERNGRLYFGMDAAEAILKAKTIQVTTELLGQPRVTKVPYVNVDGSAVCIDYDHFGRKRNPDAPTPGPFERLDRSNRFRLR